MTTKKPASNSVLDELATFNMGIAAGLDQHKAPGKGAQRTHRNSLGEAFSPRDDDGGMASLGDEPLLEMPDRTMGVTPVDDDHTQKQRGGSSVKQKSATQLPVSRLPVKKAAGASQRQAEKTQASAGSPVKSPIDPSMAPGFSWEGVKIGSGGGGAGGQGQQAGAGAAGAGALPAPQARKVQGSTGAFTATGKAPRGGQTLSSPSGRQAGSGGDYLPSLGYGGLGVPSAAPTAQGQEELLARLEAKDKEIERLEAILLAVEPSPGIQPAKMLEADRAGGRGVAAGVDPRDGKLLELAKRNRELSRAVTREAERAAKALAEGQRWKAAHAAASDRERDMRERLAQGREGGDSTAPADAPSVPDLAPALRVAQANLTKAVRERDRAMAEVKAIHKIVRKEVGPEVHLGKLLASHGVTHSMVLGSEQEQGQEEGTEASPGTGPGTGAGEGSEVIAPSQWRGRAQTIALLRAKVKDLERQLGARQQSHHHGTTASLPASAASTSRMPTQAQAQPHTQAQAPGGAAPQLPVNAGPSDAEFGLGLEDGAERSDAAGAGVILDAAGPSSGLPPPHSHTQPSMDGSTFPGLGQTFDVDDRAVATVAAREGVRAKQLQAAQAEVSSLRAERDKWKGEAAAARARGQVLDGELKKLKGHLRALLAKGETDDKLIAGLKGEIEGLKGSLEKARSKGAVATLLGVPSSLLQGGGEGEGAGEVAAARREAEEARRQAMAAERTVASLRKALRVLRDVLEANGIDPPLDSVQLGAALGGTPGQGQGQGQAGTPQHTGSKFKTLLRQASNQQMGAHMHMHAGEEAGHAMEGQGQAGYLPMHQGQQGREEWGSSPGQYQQQGAMPLSKPRAVYSTGMAT